jgi:hypothetical protein
MMLDHALACTRRGWYVFPIPPGRWPPPVKWGAAATRDEAMIRGWWAGWPTANPGIATKPSGLVVLDLDVGHVRAPVYRWGEPFTSGLVLFAELCRRADVEPPKTYSVITPSGGLHLYFEAPQEPLGNRALFDAKGVVDVRAAGGDYGGCVLAAGSVRDGRRYTPVRDAPVAPLPTWLESTLRWRRPTPPRPKYAQPGTRNWGGLVRTVEDAAEGSRNSTLYWAANRMRDDGATVEEAIEELLPAYTGDDDGVATIRSAFSGENT